MRVKKLSWTVPMIFFLLNKIEHTKKKIRQYNYAKYTYRNILKLQNRNKEKRTNPTRTSTNTTI